MGPFRKRASVHAGRQEASRRRALGTGGTERRNPTGATLHLELQIEAQSGALSSPPAQTLLGLDMRIRTYTLALYAIGRREETCGHIEKSTSQCSSRRPRHHQCVFLANPSPNRSLLCYSVRGPWVGRTPSSESQPRSHATASHPRTRKGLRRTSQCLSPSDAQGSRCPMTAAGTARCSDLVGPWRLPPLGMRHMIDRWRACCSRTLYR